MTYKEKFESVMDVDMQYLYTENEIDFFTAKNGKIYKYAINTIGTTEEEYRELLKNKDSYLYFNTVYLYIRDMVEEDYKRLLEMDYNKNHYFMPKLMELEKQKAYQNWLNS
jgi:hypothetical protein